MTIRYDFHIHTPSGQFLGVLDQRGAWSATKVAGAPGNLPLRLPLGRYPLRWFGENAQIRIWRSVDGGLPQLYADTSWFVRQLEIDEDAQTIDLEATDGIGLLESHAVLADDTPTTSDGTKFGALDDVMKAFVREQVGSLADADRQFPADLFSVAPDFSAAPVSTVQASDQDLYDTLKKVAALSLQSGTYLAFDVVYAGAGLQFQTFVGQRGADRRRSDFRLGKAYGNVSKAVLTLDWRGAANVIYANGQGEWEERLTAVAANTARATRTPWSRREKTVNASQARTQAEVDAAAAAELATSTSLPRGHFAGTFMDTPGLRYGRDLNFGDRVMVRVLERDVECRLDAVTIGETDKGEHICEIALKGEFGDFDVIAG